jgi:hypothetical protein
MWERLDATKEADLAQFHQPRSFSLARAFVSIGGFIAIVFVTPVLLYQVHPLGGLVGTPIGWLLAIALATTTPSGRGALWEYGKGRSPREMLRNAIVFVVLVFGFVAAMLLWGPWSRGR